MNDVMLACVSPTLVLVESVLSVLSNLSMRVDGVEDSGGQLL